MTIVGGASHVAPPAMFIRPCGIFAMKQKDVKLIARALRDARPVVIGKPTIAQCAGLDVHDQCVIHVSDMLHRDDESFSILDFIIACGVTPR